MYRKSWLIFALSACFLTFPFLTIISTHAGTTKSSSGQTMTVKDRGMKELTESQTNLPLFFSEIDKFSLKVKTYNNDGVIADWYTKTNSVGGREANLNVQRVSDVWFAPSAWQSAQQIDDFKEYMRTRAEYINTSSSNIIKHKSGGTDFGFSAIDGNCIFARWAFNLRGMSIYDNDEGDPDTVISLDGCNILNRDPSSVFKKIRLIDSDYRSQIANKQNNETSNTGKSNIEKSPETSKIDLKKSAIPDTASKEGKLREAKDLFSKDLISREEYEKLKKQILGLD